MYNLKKRDNNYSLYEQDKSSIPKENPLTISELTQSIKYTLQTNFSSVFAIGEISNFKTHFSSGHSYFTLKDESAQIKAVMWRSIRSRITFTPEDGMKVYIWGRITLYEPRGDYQIEVSMMRVEGMGELQFAFEKLKEKLLKEGLFDESRKRALPEYPEKVGLITSGSGAVVEDFINVAKKRFPYTTIVVIESSVQGVGSLQSILKAIKYANNPENEFDIIVLARGGGSLEDLWTFNEEQLARAIANSGIPVVSAIGHQTDFTISDFVADVRAATPSNAAEIIFKDKNDILERLIQIDYNLRIYIKERVENYKQELNRIAKSYVFNRPKDILGQHKMTLDEYEKKLTLLIKTNLDNKKEKVKNFEKILVNISPEQTLKRGFSYVLKNQKIVSRKKQLNKNDILSIKFYDGESEVQVK